MVLLAGIKSLTQTGQECNKNALWCSCTSIQAGVRIRTGFPVLEPVIDCVLADGPHNSSLTQKSAEDIQHGLMASHQAAVKCTAAVVH